MLPQFLLQLRLEGLGRKSASIPTKQLFSNTKHCAECRPFGQVIRLGRSMQVKLPGKLVAKSLGRSLEQALEPAEPDATPRSVSAEIAARHRLETAKIHDPLILSRWVGCEIVEDDDRGLQFGDLFDLGRLAAKKERRTEPRPWYVERRTAG